jgi:acyl-CoA thioester hydrolase
VLGLWVDTTLSDKRPLLITHNICVATYDIDFAGHVSNIAYFRWLEDMRLKIFEQHFPLEFFMRDGLAPVLVSTSIEYKRAIKLFDKPVGYMWVSEMGNASLTIEAELLVENRVTTTARHVGVFIDLDRGRPVRLPAICMEKFKHASSVAMNR